MRRLCLDIPQSVRKRNPLSYSRHCLSVTSHRKGPGGLNNPQTTRFNFDQFCRKVLPQPTGAIKGRCNRFTQAVSRQWCAGATLKHCTITIKHTASSYTLWKHTHTKLLKSLCNLHCKAMLLFAQMPMLASCWQNSVYTCGVANGWGERAMSWCETAGPSTMSEACARPPSWLVGSSN